MHSWDLWSLLKEVSILVKNRGPVLCKGVGINPNLSSLSCMAVLKNFDLVVGRNLVSLSNMIRDGRIVDGFDSWLTFLMVVTLSLIPHSWQDRLYSEMMAFLSMGSDSFHPDKFKHAAFKELT